MLKLKKRNVETVEGLQRDITMQALKLEKRLLESQWEWMDNLVDTRAAYIDDATGEPWSPVGRAGLSSEKAEPFLAEADLGLIRRRARALVRRNPYAENLLINLTSFIVGQGHKYDVVQKVKNPAYKTRSAILERQLQKFLDKLLKDNRWKKRQKEICRRFHRDGEVFVRIFPQADGYAKFRFIEPFQVKTPQGYQGDRSADFGIKTEEDDIETVEMYFVDDEEVMAHEVQHRKANVDMNCKRGVPSLYCVQANLERGNQILQNMSTLLQTRAAIAMIRRHDKTSGSVRSFAAANATVAYTNPLTQEAIKGKRLRPGSVIDTTKATEYEFPSLNANASDGTDILGAELRAVASSKSLAEYMVGSDASNANYASTMVAESPAVRFFEGEQDEMIEADLDLIWAAVDYAIDAGILPPEVRTFCDIQVEPPPLVTRDPLATAQANDVYLNRRIKSPQTVQTELGLDAEQEQANWTAFDDANLEGGPLPTTLPGGPKPAGDYIPPAEDTLAVTEPEAALLNMAGGISGYIEIMTALKDGAIEREQAMAAIKKFFKLSDEDAYDLVGGVAA